MLLILTGLAISSAAQAGSHLYRLDMRYEGPAPAGTTHLEVLISEGQNCEHFKGSSEADFDGTSISNLVSDDVVAITGAEIVGGSMILTFSVTGYDNGHFKADTCFEVTEGGSSTNLSFHTSCSQPILMETPLPGDPVGTFYIADGDGDCLTDGSMPEDCPFDNRLYWLAGKFVIPCASPANLTFTVSNDGDVTGVSSAYFDGNGLVGTTSDSVALLWDAFYLGGELVVQFEAFGFHSMPGHFHAHSGFKLEVEGCGTFSLDDYHTSCSQTIVLDVPMPLDCGAGELTFLNMCGCQESVVANETMSWGDLKSSYK